MSKGKHGIRRWLGIRGGCLLAAVWLLLELAAAGAQAVRAEAVRTEAEPVEAVREARSSEAHTGAKAEASSDAAYAILAGGSRIPAEREYTVPEQPTVYLTFDDGPSKYTEQVLDILKKEQVRGTFFIVGQLVAGWKEVVARISEEGHAIGNHSYNHVYSELYGSFGGFWNQVARTDSALEEVLGEKPFLLRAPGGSATNFDPFYFYYLEQAGYSIVDWNVDSGDAVRQGVTAAEIVANVRKSPLKHQLTVLMHDGAGHGETVKALPEIIAYYREKGYAFAALDRSVKPEQFALAKSKWKRSYTREGFASSSELASASGLAREEQVRASEARRLLADNSLRAQEEAAAALAALAEQRASEVPLVVSMEEGPAWTLEPGGYTFTQGRFAVPLRELAERMGAKVAWDGERRIATVRAGLLTVEVDPIRRTITEIRPGRDPVVRHLADVSLAEGEIRIPLRYGAGLLGSRVEDYNLDPWDRRVMLASGGGNHTAILHPFEGMNLLRSHV